MAARITFVVLAMSLVTACGGSGGGGGGGASTDAGTEPPPDGDMCINGTLCGAPVMCCPTGNECVEDRCLAACSSGVRCGATLDVCCNAGEVCLSNACVAPGHACSDPYDCDPGNFCEPTLNECLPQPDALTCQLVPQFTDLTLLQEWAATDLQIISIPVVANLD